MTIEEIENAVRNCKKCPLHAMNIDYRYKRVNISGEELLELEKSGTDLELKAHGINTDYNYPVPGIGSPTASAMIIGEAPGSEEARNRKPFVGKAGEFLRKVIDEIGFPADKLYISNVLKCRPQNNEFPTDEFIISSCLKYIKAEILAIKPKVIITCGNKPLKYLFNKDTRVSDVMGNHLTYHLANSEDTILVIPTMHPAFCIRRSPTKPSAKPVEEMSRGELMMAMNSSQKQDLFFKHVKEALDLAT
jgi:DNA polymerase